MLKNTAAPNNLKPSSSSRRGTSSCSGTGNSACVCSFVTLLKYQLTCLCVDWSLGMQSLIHEFICGCALPRSLTYLSIFLHLTLCVHCFICFVILLLICLLRYQNVSLLCYYLGRCVFICSFVCSVVCSLLLYIYVCMLSFSFAMGITLTQFMR